MCFVRSFVSEVVSIYSKYTVANVTKATYQKIRKLCSGLFLGTDAAIRPDDDTEL